MNSPIAGDAGFALITMQGDCDSVRAGLERAMTVPPLRRLTQSDRDRAEILMVEVLNNIVEHAYRELEGEIRILLRLESKRLCLVIEDEGIEMPGGTLPAGELPEPSLLPEGGFGWFLIRNMAAEICYLRRGLTNRLDIEMSIEQ